MTSSRKLTLGETSPEGRKLFTTRQSACNQSPWAEEFTTCGSVAGWPDPCLPHSTCSATTGSLSWTSCFGQSDAAANMGFFLTQRSFKWFEISNLTNQWSFNCYFKNTELKILFHCFHVWLCRIGLVNKFRSRCRLNTRYLGPFGMVIPKIFVPGLFLEISPRFLSYVVEITT